MSLFDIIEIQQRKKNKEIDMFEKIYEDVKTKIQYYVTMNQLTCIFKIPSFIFGFPLVNISKTMEYILLRLTKEGFIAFKVQNKEDEVFISWEISSVLKKQIKKETKISVENEIKMSRQDDLIQSLISAKLNNQ